MSKNKKSYLIKRKPPGENQEMVNMFGWGLLAFLLIYLLYTSIMVFSSDQPKKVDQDNSKKPVSSTTTTLAPVKEPAKKVRIVGNNINVRSAPEISSGNVIIRLEQDVEVSLVAEEDGWFHIKLQDKRDGYIKSDPTIAEIVSSDGD